MTEPTEERPIVSAEDVARRYELEQARMSLDAGWLGKIFGSATYAPTNIAGFVVCCGHYMYGGVSQDANRRIRRESDPHHNACPWLPFR